MATQVQVRNGTTAQTAAFTGAVAEISVNTQQKRLVVHDGVTPGGTPQATKAEVDSKEPLLGFTPEDVANKSIDGTLAANSDTLYPSQKAVKTYADTKQPALGFTPENVANKSTDGTFAANSDTLYPSQKAAKTYADTGLALKENVANKSTDGTLAANSDTLYPSQKAVKTYADAIAAASTAGLALKVNKAGDTMTGALVHPVGTELLPSVTFTSDLDTGFFSSGSNAVDLTTGGTTRLRTSVGIVGDVFFQHALASALPSTGIGLGSAIGSMALWLGRTGTAGVLALNNGTTSVSTFQVYETVASGGFVNYSRLSFITQAGNHLIRTEADSTSTLRILQVGTGPEVGTDQTGVNSIYHGGQGTGLGAGGSILLQVAPAGSTGASANALITVGTILSTGVLTLTPKADGITRLQFDADGFLTNTRQEADVSAGGISLNKRGTTGDATAAVSSGSALTGVSFKGWDGAAFGTGALIRAFTREAFTGTAYGTSLIFAVVAPGTTSIPTAMTLNSDGLNVVSTITAGAALYTKVVAATDAATIATNAALGNHFRVTLGGNRTLGNPTNSIDGQRVIWELIQDGTGTRTITLDTNFALGTDIASVTLSTAINKRDFMTAIYNSTAGKWYVVGFVRGY